LLANSNHVSLFHEYASNIFFDRLNGLFDEERRHRGFPDFSLHQGSMPVEARDQLAIATDIFARVLGKRSAVIGTKFPGHQLWPAPRLPAGMRLRELIVIRNPLETVISSIEKAIAEHGALPAALAIDTALRDWAHAWNYCILNRSEKIKCVLMDTIEADPADAAADIAAFLGIPNDLDLSSVRGQSNKIDIENRYRKLNLLSLYRELRQHWVPQDWKKTARTKIKSNELFGTPLRSSSIDFKMGGDAWKYVQRGFYPPEPLGSWTCGSRATIVFYLPSMDHADFRLTLDIIWAPLIALETTRVAVMLDGVELSQEIDLGNVINQLQSLSFDVWNFEPKAAGTRIEIIVDNPRSPMAAGESTHDNRELGFMLQALRFEPVLRRKADG
jgi:hypothetical protein